MVIFKFEKDYTARVRETFFLMEGGKWVKASVKDYPEKDEAKAQSSAARMADGAYRDCRTAKIDKRNKNRIVVENHDTSDYWDEFKEVYEVMTYRPGIDEVADEQYIDL